MDPASLILGMVMAWIIALLVYWFGVQRDATEKVANTVPLKEHLTQLQAAEDRAAQLQTDLQQARRALEEAQAAAIVLIGAMCAGKSTVAQHLSQKLNQPYIELDDLRWDYYKENGYDEAEASRIAAQEDGARALLQYWKPFEAYAVERVLSEHDHGIIAFGAGHSVFEEEALFVRVQHALAPYPWVVLLLPSPDLDASVSILNARFEKLLQNEGIEVDPSLLAVNEQFVRHASNFLLAKLIVFTEGQSPEETADEILQRIAWATDTS